MEIRQLKYFVQIAHDQNYSLAAQKLHITQPTLSWNIKCLAEELGTQLFVYDNKRLILTDTGKELLIQAEKLIKDFDTIIENIQDKNNALKGYIKLGIPEMFSVHFLVPVIMSFAKANPAIKVILYEKGSLEIEELVLNGTVDVGIISLPANSNELNAIEIPNIYYSPVLVVNKNHHLAKCQKVSPSDLKDEQFAYLTQDFTFNKTTSLKCKDAGFSPDIAVESSCVDFIIEVISNTSLISVLPDIFFKCNDTPNIKTIPIDCSEKEVKIGIITKKYYDSLFVDKLIEYTINHIM